MSKQLIPKWFVNNIGGWVKTNLIAQPLNSSREMLDCRTLETGEIAKRLGDTYVGGVNSESAGYRGLYQFMDSDGIFRQVALAGTNILNLDLSDGGLTSLYASLTDDDGRLYDFTQYDHRVIMAQEDENVRSWNGTDTVTTKIQDITQKSALTGTITFAASTAVTGSGTAFESELEVGDYISKTGSDGFWLEVSAIASDTALTLRKTYTGGAGAGGSGTSYVSGDWGKASLVINFENHLLCFDTYSTRDGERRRNQMAYSYLNQPFNFPANSVHEFRKAGTILGAFTTKEFLYVITDVQLYRVSPTGDPVAPFYVDEADISINTDGGRSVQVVPSAVYNKKIAVWMDTKGIHVFDGNEVNNITDKRLKEEVLKLSANRGVKITSMVNSEFGEVWFFVSKLNQTKHNAVWVYNYNTDAIYPFTGNWNCGYEIDFSQVNTTEKLYPVTGDYNGYITRQNDGATYQRGTINFKYLTPLYDLGDPALYKTFRELLTIVKATGDVDITLKYRNAFSTSWKSLTDINCQDTAESTFPATFPITFADENSNLSVKTKFQSSANVRIQFMFSNRKDGDEIVIPGWGIFFRPKKNYKRG